MLKKIPQSITQDEELSVLLDTVLPLLDERQRQGLHALFEEHTRTVEKEEEAWKRTLTRILHGEHKRIAHDRRIVLIRAIAKRKAPKHSYETN